MFVIGKKSQSFRNCDKISSIATARGTVCQPSASIAVRQLEEIRA